MDQNNSILMRKLPPGFRFQPTDEELVFEYLKRKILSWPLPASIIPEINLCNYDPWDLPGEMEKDSYFFSSNEAKYPNGKRINRATASGYWKATGIDRQIASSTVVGMKKTLVFYTGKHPHSSRSNWIMHEYRIVSFPNSDFQICGKQMEKWVLCRIFMKNKNTGRNNREEPIFYDFMKRCREMDYDYESVCSSSNSSNITEVCSNGEDEQISRDFF
ncbi:NAC domain-containing protein 83 [Euphorbia lathyris]|uniref:NAC domain-containing protein 83 n=1 Tax=Euphorbia lathyris TaxID=212925 RepID=UPI0033137153